MSDLSPPPGSDGGSAPERFLARVRRALEPRYEVIEHVGAGGMAAVFRALEPRLGRDVAVKVMAPRLMSDESMVRRFEYEARTTAQLSSPYVVTVYEVDERDGLHYIVMRFVGGRTLARVMDRPASPIPLAVASAWLAQVATALTHAHGRGVVHRDIKPSNILLDRDGAALVSDFGIAKITLEDPNLTRTGQIVGTPAYMSPEQCHGEAATASSDQYALGAVAYQLLTGQPPFRGSTLEVLNAHVREPPLPIRELRPDCPPSLAEGVERMLAKAPGDRWPTLAHAMTELEIAPPPPTHPIWETMASLAVPVTEIRVDGTPPGLPVGERGRIEATPLGPEGQPLRDRRIRWRSGSPEVARVDGDGTVEGRRMGVSVLEGHCEGAVTHVPIGVADGTAPSAAPDRGPEGEPLGAKRAPVAPLPPEQEAQRLERGPGSVGEGPSHAVPGPSTDSPVEAGHPRFPPRGRAAALAGGAGILVGLVAWSLLRGTGTEPPMEGAGLAEPDAPVVGGVVEGRAGDEPDPPGVVDPRPDPVEADRPAAEEDVALESAEESPTEVDPAPDGAEAEAERPAEGDDAAQLEDRRPEPDPEEGPEDPPPPDPEPDGGRDDAPAPDEAEPAPYDAEPADVDSDVARISALVRRLMEGVANRDAEAVEAEYPDFGGTERWWVYGEDDERVFARTVQLVPESEVIPIGTTATVVFSMTIRLQDEDGGTLDEEIFPLTMRFERDGEGWMLRDLW